MSSDGNTLENKKPNQLRQSCLTCNYYKKKMCICLNQKLRISLLDFHLHTSLIPFNVNHGLGKMLRSGQRGNI